MAGRHFNTPLLRRRRFTGGAAAIIDAYAVAGFSPDLVTDFSGILNSGTEYYRTAGTETTFDSMFSYTGASNKTMTDSDGNLKWAPHNVLPYSSDLTGWSELAMNFTTNTTTAPDGTTTADTTLIDPGAAFAPAGGSYFSSFTYTSKSFAAVVGATYTVVAYIKSAGTFDQGQLRIAEDIILNLNPVQVKFTFPNTVEGTPTLSNFSVTDQGDGWSRVEGDFTATATTMYAGIWCWNSTDPTPTDGSEGYHLWGFHVYRSDLGGMVDNWDAATGFETYVPTTTSAVYLPRRNSYRYNGSSYVNKGITFESEARTNLIVQSNAFTTTWTDTNATPASGAATGPDGETSMWNLVDDGTTGTGEVYLDYSLTGLSTSTAYTFSVFLKANALSWAALGTENFTTPANGESYFNLSTGAKGTAASGHTQNVEEVASGIYRCSITFTTDGTDTAGNVRIYVADADTDNTVDLDGTSSIYVYGAQIEAGSTPSSYIPTVGATATRAAETLTIAGANMAYSATAMSFQMQGEFSYADNNTPGSISGLGGEAIFYSWRTDASNYIEATLSTLSAAEGVVIIASKISGTRDESISTSEYTPGVNVGYNIAGRYTSSSVQGAKDGTASTANNTLSSLPNLAASTMSLRPSSVGFITTGYGNFGTIALFRQWDVDLGDTGLESATS